MKVYKRNGQEVDFALDKIKGAIDKANRSTFKKFESEIENECFSNDDDLLTYDQILTITEDNFDWDNPDNWKVINKPLTTKDKLIKGLTKYILVDGTLNKAIEQTQKFLKPFDTVTVEDISDLVEKALMKVNAFEVAKEFITYRENKKKNKKFTDTEEKVLTVIDGTNEELRGDNANKHIDINSSARDYIAGTVCKSIADKILTSDITKAHKEGYIHWHDKDYSPVQHMTNCCLLNTEDMLVNGFQMGDAHIDRPRRVSTSGNLMSQIALIVSGLQYGGQTSTISAMLPIIKTTRIYCAQDTASELSYKDYKYYTKYNTFEDIYKAYKKEVGFLKSISKEKFQKIVDQKVRHDIHVGIKTYAWQIICHHSSNGQSPFTSLVLDLREAEDEQEQKDLAVLIEEVIDRRIKGVTGSHGEVVTPLFPKLLYWTCDGLNVNPGDPYYYLTKKAAKCISLRMAPDINSEKMSRKIKQGQVIPSMGCVKGDSKVQMSYKGKEFIDTFENIWLKFSKMFEIRGQFEIEDNPNKIIYLENIKIWDNVKRTFVKCLSINKNISDIWQEVILINKNNPKDFIKIKVTDDHIFTLVNGKDVKAKDLSLRDEIYGGYNGEDIYKVKNIFQILKKDFSYDVTTTSEHFMVNNLYSHNCRSWLTPLWIEKTYPIGTKFHWQYINEGNIQYEGAYGKNFDYNRKYKPLGDYSELPIKALNGDYKGVAINFRGNTGWIKDIETDEKGNELVRIIEPKVYGRWNNGVITLNIPMYAGEARLKVNKSHGNDSPDFFEDYKTEYLTQFKKGFDEGLELCHKALILRNDYCKKIKAKNSPLLWMYGGFLRETDPEKTLGQMMEEHPLYNTISLGFVGLYETSEALLNKSNTTKEGQDLCIDIMKHMNEKVTEWRQQAIDGKIKELEDKDFEIEEL